MKNSLVFLLLLLFATGDIYSKSKKSTITVQKEKSQSTRVIDKDSIGNIFLVGNAHIDLGYRWDWNETVERVLPETFRGVLRMMDKVPGLTFAQCQMAVYEEVMKKDPSLFRDIKKRIDDGSLSVTGGQWCEPDKMIAGGESYIRQFLLGNEFNIGDEKFEIETRNPDAGISAVVESEGSIKGRYYSPEASEVTFRWRKTRPVKLNLYLDGLKQTVREAEDGITLNVPAGEHIWNIGR